MTSKIRLLALIGFTCLAVGLCLGTIGFLSNGPEALSNLNKPVKQEVTFDNVKSLHIELIDHAINIKESKDDKVHVTYQQFQGKETNKIVVKDKNGQLRITDRGEQLPLIQLPLEAISRALSEHKYKAHTMTLYLPKNMTLEELSGIHYLGHELSLNHLHIKDFQYQGHVYTDNVTIEGGYINTGTFVNSLIKKAKLRTYTLSLQNTTVQDSQVDIQQWADFRQVTFKNTKLNAEHASRDLDFEGITLDNSSLVAYNYSLAVGHCSAGFLVSLVDVGKVVGGNPVSPHNVEVKVDLVLAITC